MISLNIVVVGGMMCDQVPAAGWFRFNVRQANCNWYCRIGHSLFEKFLNFFLEAKPWALLPKEAQIWLKFFV